FPPTVIRSAGPCYSQKPVAIQNTGACSVTIVSLTITGADASEFTLSGLPGGAPATRLTPGELLGDGKLAVQFRPTQIRRVHQALLNVTYITDPITGAATTVVIPLYGEGVTTGARGLVRLNGVPFGTLEKLQLQRIVGNRTGS